MLKVSTGEYKVMGLAPYGKPKYVDLIKNNLLIFSSDGSFKLNMNYFSFPIENKMINKNFENLFGHHLVHLKHSKFVKKKWILQRQFKKLQKILL